MQPVCARSRHITSTLCAVLEGLTHQRTELWCLSLAGKASMSVALGTLHQASARCRYTSYWYCASRRVRTAAHKEEPQVRVNRRVAALLAATLPPAVQALAAEEEIYSKE